jgi:hypothetical protein
VLVGAFNDLLKNFASSLSREQMLTAEWMHLNELNLSFSFLL